MNKIFACMVAAAVMTFSAADAEAQYYRGGGRSGFNLSIGSGYGGGFGGSRYGYGGYGRGFGGSGININVGRPVYRGGGFYGGGYGGGYYAARPVVRSVPVYGGYGGGYYGGGSFGRSGCRGW